MAYSNSCVINDSFIFEKHPDDMDYVVNFNVIDDVKFKIPLTVFLILTAILSLIGNLCTCFVIVRNPSMKTPTNFYLFNLAVADLLTILCVPIELFMIWVPNSAPFGEIVFRIHFIVWDCLCNCSILTIFAFTVERYFVISKPFLRQSLGLKSRVIKIIVFIWILSFIFCFMQAFNILFERDKGIYCHFKITNKMLIVMIIHLFVFFVFPMTVIAVTYVLIAVKLKYTNNKMNTSPANGQRNKMKAIIMLAAVTVSFFFCWFPYSVLRVMMIIPALRKNDYYKIWNIFVYVTSVNSYLSTAINPILYSLMSRKFRRAFKNLLSGRGSMPLETVSNLSLANTASDTRLKKLRQQYSC